MALQIIKTFVFLLEKEIHPKLLTLVQKFNHSEYELPKQKISDELSQCFLDTSNYSQFKVHIYLDIQLYTPSQIFFKRNETVNAITLKNTHAFK